MDKVVLFLGIVIFIIGIVYLLKPEVLRRQISFFKQGKRMYFAGVIRLVLAVVFLVAARECGIAWVIVVFGIVFLISGLLIFMLGPEKVKSILDWWEKQSSVLLRILGAVTMVAGGVVIYSAWG